MKKLILLIFLSSFYLITLPETILAQDRIQSIQTGITLLGATKPTIQHYLVSKGFTFHDNIIGYCYSKEVQFGRCDFIFGLKNQKADAISWTEDNIFGQECLSEVRDSNFEMQLHVLDGGGVGDIKCFSCYNYPLNLMVTLIFRPDLNYFTITVGNINPVNVDGHNGKKNTTAENTNNSEPLHKYVVVSQKTDFCTLNKIGPVTKSKGYLVYGETIIGLQENDPYVYCDFINSVTKKNTKGWIFKGDLEDYSDFKTGSLNAVSNPEFKKLIQLDGKYSNDIHFYTPIIISELKRVLDSDYDIFIETFPEKQFGDPIYVRNNVLYLDAYSGNLKDDFFLFIDLSNQKTFLYWKANSLVNQPEEAFGDSPNDSNIGNFINKWLVNRNELSIALNRQTLINILNNQMPTGDIRLAYGKTEKMIDSVNAPFAKLKGTKENLNLTEMIEIVNRYEFTVPEIQKYLSAHSSRKWDIKRGVEQDNGKIDYTKINISWDLNSEEGMIYDSQKHVLHVYTGDQDFFDSLLKKLDLSNYKKTAFKATILGRFKVLYQNENNSFLCTQDDGGTMHNVSCDIIISRTSPIKK